jgi:hypothetical protein
MHPRAWMLLLAMVLAPFACSYSAAKSDDPSVASPLHVEAQFSANVGGDCKTGEGLVVQLRYSGERPVRAYLVKFSLANSATGKPVRQLTIDEAREAHQMIASGAEWTRTVCTKLKATAPDSISVTADVDMLKFDDGSTWGPLESRESHQLIGTIDGMDFITKTTELKGFVTPILPDRGPLPDEYLESQTIGPLKIESGVWRDEDGRDMLAVAVTNETDLPIRGYLLTATFFDPATGTRIRRASTKELETQGNPSDYLEPGATWVADPRKFSRLPDGSLASYKIDVDLVVFADGSTFGPKRSQESDEVLGMFRGIDAENDLTRGVSPAKDH